MIRIRLNQFGTLTSAVALAVLVAAGTATPVTAQDKPQKVVLRFAADFPPPPHPAGLAMRYFAERLPLMFCGGKLVWVAGLGVDCDFQAKGGEAAILPGWAAG